MIADGFHPEITMAQYYEVASTFSILCHCLYPTTRFFVKQHAAIQAMKLPDSPKSEWVSPELWANSTPNNIFNRVQGCFFDAFAAAGGMEMVMRLLHTPERCCLSGCEVLVQFISACHPLLSHAKREEIYAALWQLYEHIDSCFEGTKGLEGFKNVEGMPVHQALISVLNQTSQILMLDSSRRESSNRKASKYYRRIILALFDSGNVALQLTAVKELNILLLRPTMRYSVEEDGSDHHSKLPILLKWIEEDDIVSRMLQSNLHLSQYIEDVQSVLQNLIIFGLLTDDHISMLWKFIEDENTFDEIKVNVSHLLGSLAPRMPVQQVAKVLNSLTSESFWSTNSKIVVDMMKFMAKNDCHGILMKELLRHSYALAVDVSMQDDEAQHLLIELCQRYQHLDMTDEYFMEIIMKCATMIEMGELDTMMKPLQVLKHILADGYFPKVCFGDCVNLISPHSVFLHYYLIQKLNYY